MTARASSSPRKTARRAAPRRAGHDASAIVAQIASIAAGRGSGTVDFGDGSTLDVSNLGKTFFPAQSYTKGDLMAYYAGISPLLLPAIADRPLVLKRYPNGVASEAFYQQKAPEEAPTSVRVEEVSDEGLTTQRRLVGGDLPTLLYLVQLGAISVDPWHSRVGSVTYADYSIVDLDPGPRAPFRRVIQTACWVKEELDALGLRGVPKTSGASGLHIVLPLAPRTTNDAARLVAELVATRVAQRHQREATVHRWVQSRPATAVYVDFLQNIRGKTVAGVYSARATPDATVSAPLRWDELTADLDPREFTIATMPARVRDVGDLWSAGMGEPNDLRRLLGTDPSQRRRAVEKT